MIKAFFITSEKNLYNYKKIYLYAKNLTFKYSFKISEIHLFNLKIIIVHNSNKEIKYNINQDLIIKVKNNKIPEESYANLRIRKKYIEVDNDYCGTIPVYYSTNNNSLCLPNLEVYQILNI